MMLLMLLAAAAASQPGELKTFKDWTVGCDNGRACQAVALQPEGDFESATMAVQRGAEASAAAEIRIDAREAKPAAVVVDGRSYALEETAMPDGAPIVRPRDGTGFLKALSSARSAALVDRQGKRVASLSPAGASAALLYMDEKQNRIGTVTALSRPGPKPASAVPAPAPLPVVQRPLAQAKSPRTLSKAQVRRLLGREETVCDHAQEMTVEAVRLDARHSLVLSSHPCGNGAYNHWSSAFIVSEDGRARHAPVETTDRETEGTNRLMNAAWDAERRLLSTFMRGRGIGDCGSRQEFAWDGARFRLVREDAMGECRGSIDFITTWRAAVR